ncbi:NAD dependent epimerase/dehydratase [Aspergillus piperis CBS 112811]|uniref:NAD dependent epimerase/dehydratase n=1 Tax=Aspergillus piperis CBS 112811 TaxID=1448313 RepID=A0A8G1QX36_9EURO|nr:NAD dependent epimerase/dehydratase [Aspergillus piperis CBS 112811]RAH54462.1 NAD dependent epimerase/dehydratase [Aspergillus piperis CBS 112811]
MGSLAKKVLLTGGTGFIASHILTELLDAGYQVVVTVRTHDKGRQLLTSLSNTGDQAASYVVVEDIGKDGAYNEAIQSISDLDLVVHTASPYHFNYTDPESDFLDPAIKGTAGLLASIKAYAPTVKRVVVTSSSATIVTPPNHPEVYDETSYGSVTWEEAMVPEVTYRASKIFAERAAFEFVEKEKPNFDLVTINPPLVFGPKPRHVTDLKALNTSNHIIRDLMLGKWKDGGAPIAIPFTFVDVRDVAFAHRKALELPEVSGHRFFTVAGHFSNKQVAEAIRATHPELAHKLPPSDMPDDLPQPIFGFDNSKSRRMLGMTFRDLNTCVGDAVTSMMERAHL